MFCLPASASTLIKIGGCLDTDGDFDSVSYKFSWPGSTVITIADGLFNAQPVQFTSPLTAAKLPTMAFESNISRSESDDTEFRHSTPCQRHITNPADPNPGDGLRQPAAGIRLLPLLQHHPIRRDLLVPTGRPLIRRQREHSTDAALRRYGPLRAIAYPTSPFGTVTTRYNDFRSAKLANPCPTG